MCKWQQVTPFLTDVLNRYPKKIRLTLEIIFSGKNWLKILLLMIFFENWKCMNLALSNVRFEA